MKKLVVFILTSTLFFSCNNPKDDLKIQDDPTSGISKITGFRWENQKEKSVSEALDNVYEAKSKIGQYEQGAVELQEKIVEHSLDSSILGKVIFHKEIEFLKQRQINCLKEIAALKESIPPFKSIYEDETLLKSLSEQNLIELRDMRAAYMMVEEYKKN